MPEMDEPVNVDLEPEDALRVLLGVDRRETDDECEPDADEQASDENT